MRYLPIIEGLGEVMLPHQLPPPHRLLLLKEQALLAFSFVCRKLETSSSFLSCPRLCKPFSSALLHNAQHPWQSEGASQRGYSPSWRKEKMQRCEAIRGISIY